jgi:glycosyltransferase involved in cell wall biosynthesis
LKGTSSISASVIIPTRDRAASLIETLDILDVAKRKNKGVEIVVVDDGSDPPSKLGDERDVRLVRREARGRSAARNSGAQVAEGDLLVFLDDDMSISPGFLEAHFRAMAEWPGALAVGAVRLPHDALGSPFGRFRQRLEDAGMPTQRGVTGRPNLCGAGNMSVPRSRFLALGGFDPYLANGEDQDLALRHSSDGGLIAFIPEALAIHRDQALDIRSYCRRVESGSEHDVAFVRKQPGWPENLDRQRINGRLAFGEESFKVSLGKVSKALLGYGPFQETLFLITTLLERMARDSAALDLLYRILLGIHIRRGYMRGLRALPS